MRRGSTLYYLHGDHLGSTALTTTGSGTGVSQTYCAYGKKRSGATCASGNALATDRQFTGQKYDVTGLHYYNARYFDDHIGQFVSPDSVVPDPATLIDYNRFAYATDNPLNMSDPDGHEPCPTGAWGDCRPNRSYAENYRLARHYVDFHVDWNNVPAEAQAVLKAGGETEGTYSDLAPSVQVQTGLRDPATLAASLFGIGRLVLQLPVLLTPCLDDACDAEIRTFDMAIKKFAKFDPAKATQQFNELLDRGIKLTDHALREAQADSISTQKIADTFSGTARNTQYFWTGGRVAQWSPHTKVAVIIEKATMEVVTVFNRSSPGGDWQRMTPFEVLEWLGQ